MANKKIINSGLLNLSALLRQCKAKHSAFWKKENGDIVCWVNQLESDEPDQHGQTSTIILNGKKEFREQEKSNDNFICNIVYWVNQLESDEPDQHGQTSTIILNGKKEFREQEKSNDNFICNMKPNTQSEGSVTDNDLNNLPKEDDLFL